MTTNTDTDSRQLQRVRLFVRGCFWTGVLVSLIANVLHADPNPISQAIAAWAPLALLLAVELLTRVPITRSTRSGLRLTATGIVAGIAAWVSYQHMAGVAHQYGETGLIPYLLPVSVDGLVVIASISLVEINNRIRRGHTAPATTTTADNSPTTATPATPSAATTTTDTPATPRAAGTGADTPALNNTAAALAAQFTKPNPTPAPAIHNGHHTTTDGGVVQESLL